MLSKIASELAHSENELPSTKIVVYTGKHYTVMTLSFQTDSYGQTVQTQIRLFLEKQTDQGLLFYLLLFEEIHKGLAFFLEFMVDYSKVFWCSKI